MQIDKEGTSSYLYVSRVMQLVVFSLCFPQKDIFIMDNLHAALEADSLVSSHPLNPPQEDVQTTQELNGMFDTITYSKVGQQLMIIDQSFCRLFSQIIV